MTAKERDIINRALEKTKNINKITITACIVLYCGQYVPIIITLLNTLKFASMKMVFVIIILRANGSGMG